LPGLEFVQFIDGDCEIRTDWGRHAVDALKADDSLAVVCGRRRERRPDASIYNQLCDIEWDTGVGEALACGGDAMMRVRAFRGVGGFDPTVIAGEEPELCVRLRRDGWKIRRIDAEMTLHDADITHFSQWWKRARRSGFAYGLGYLMHGQPPERHWRSECIRIAFWGATLPLAALLLGWLVSPWAILILPVGYAISGWRVFRATRSVRPSLPARAAAWYATFTLIGRVPELIGLVQCLVGQVLKKERRIIEYK
jgi:GT2 family glycosyltransferase